MAVLFVAPISYDRGDGGTRRNRSCHQETRWIHQYQGPCVTCRSTSVSLYWKLHAILGWLAIFASGGGIYCIYRNKEINGFSHLKSPHSICGVGVAVSFLGLGLAGSIFLHPDFGIDKTNKLIRTAHKLASRATIALAWVTALGGLLQLGAEPMILALYALPLLALAPLSLI